MIRSPFAALGAAILCAFAALPALAQSDRKSVV